MSVLLFFGVDLSARLRLKQTAGSIGMELVARTRLIETDAPAEVVVVDLDWATPELAEAIASTFKGSSVVGYYSHIDEAVGERASGLGIDAYPRSRFWRETTKIIAKALDESR